MVEEVKRGAWSPEEDRKLVSYISKHGIWNWNQMPKFAGLARTGKSCRLRWVNYLRPDLKRGPFTMEEVEIFTKMYQSIGDRWSAIAAQLPGRSDNEIKNFYHTHLKKHMILRQVEKDNTIPTSDDNAKIIANDSTNNDVTWVGEFKDVFVENHEEEEEEECKLFGSVVILESNPSIVENDCGYSEDYYDVNAFWYDVLMEAEYLKF